MFVLICFCLCDSVCLCKACVCVLWVLLVICCGVLYSLCVVSVFVVYLHCEVFVVLVCALPGRLWLYVVCVFLLVLCVCDVCDWV